MESLLSFKFKYFIRFFIVLIILISVFLMFEKFLIKYLYEEQNIISDFLKLPFSRGRRTEISLPYLIIIIFSWIYLGWISYYKLKQYIQKLKRTPLYFRSILESFLGAFLFIFLYMLIIHTAKYQSLHFFHGDFFYFWIILFFFGVCIRYTFEKSVYRKMNNEIDEENLLAESPISSWEEDLIERNSVINNLIMEINSSFEEGGGVVACYGARGMGKTSALNLLRINLRVSEFKLIDFHPWRYKDEREMVRNFFSRITSFLTQNYNLPFLNSIPQKYTDLILGLPKPPFVDFSKISEFLRHEKDYDALRFEIKAVLDILNIRIIMIIDDIDRCSSKGIILLLRLFNTIGNLKNIVFLITTDLDVIRRKIEQPTLVEVI